MKLQATNFNGQDVRVSFEAENHAERCQLDHFFNSLEAAHAATYTWSDMDNMSGGIGVVVKLKKTLVAK